MMFTIEEINRIIEDYWDRIDEREYPDAFVAIGRLRLEFWQANRIKENHGNTNEQHQDTEAEDAEPGRIGRAGGLDAES